ncbi:4'-phosphopantetheinyl transferase superfamily protein [Pedobacter sp. HMF7647]|uniref:4'-phosphopantetheinyl transferase superfamily protein n=1 Tax=Hufsiella arboris TaxID=2695275 RepID=A0A7K1Y4W3_9SPHI|nr:4'-phosphopantetheinyl transferase superfamily protein [Hufsiella arboris]MXV49450.1 4'-phosphopantetheinyl transferase superfamily protein [Hufsiella arboris]
MGLVYSKALDGKTSFALWKIEETPEQLYSKLQLKAHEKDYLEKLSHNKRNLHWLSTRVLLREMLNTTKYIDCQVDTHGKPYLVNFPQHISLSHSYDYAAVMISEDKPVGIDIELIKTKITIVAPKFMNEDELAFIDQENRIDHLYICWCAKEAIYKLHGKNNVSFLQNIRLRPFVISASGTFAASLELEGYRQDFTIYFEKFNDYMIGYVAG